MKCGGNAIILNASEGSALRFRISVVHNGTPGRARLQVAGLRGNTGLRSMLETALPGSDGIHSVSASTITGNILVHYDSGRRLSEVVGFLEVVVRKPGDYAAGTAPKPAPPATGLWSFLKSLLQRTPATKPPELFSPAARRQGASKAGAEIERMPAPWHTVPAGEVAEFWATLPDMGLSRDTARRRLLKYGPNILTPIESRSPLAMFLGQFRSLPVALLLAAAALSVATGGMADAVVIMAVVVLNAGIGFLTEFRAERTIASLLEITEPDAAVLRDGVPRQVSGDEIVPGDLLLLSRGDPVVADARLLSCTGLSVDEAVLTGESIPAEKSAAPLGLENPPLADRLNMVFRGAVITGGNGIAIVVATGRHTEIGGIQRLIGESAQPETPLQRQMERLGRQLVWLTAAIVGVVFGIGLLRGYSVLEMLRSAISLAIAAVPEGLPTVATVCLAKGVHSLLRHQVLVRRLEAVEALGAVQVVCFDKTGTLTLNRMAVVAAFVGFRRYGVGGGTFFAGDRPVHLTDVPELLKLIEVCCLCSEAELREQDGKVIPNGTPTETALLRMGLNTGIDVPGLRRRFPLLKTQLRSEANAYMATWHASPDGRVLTAVKGSPPEVLGLCDWCARDGRVHAFTDAEREELLARNTEMAGTGLRMLGVACLEHKESTEARGMVWLGLVALADPPRQGLKEVLREFRRAGVKPLIVTGDQAATAGAIAQTLELNGNGNPEAASAADLDRLGPDEIGAVLRRATVFSRVSPSDKLRIIQALQSEGSVVAMTGDGVNDAPALKASDIGIALGNSGTRVARGVADVILTDDSIGALLPAIREGRTVYVDLRKAVQYIGATNMSEISVMLACLATGLGQPFNPRQLLWINLISDVFPELALALEPPEGDLMSQPPRDPRRDVIGPAEYARLGLHCSIMSTASIASYLFGIARYGIGPRASSMAFLSLTSAQLLHGLTARSEQHGLFHGNGVLAPNPYMSGGLLAGFGLLVLSQFVPGLTALLGTSRIGILDALVCAGAALSSYLANEALKRPAARALAAAPRAHDFSGKELEYGALRQQ